ncbi:MAG: hypothetical protein ABJK28_05135 [Algibacter sp.]
MKNSILIIGTVVLSILNMNATNEKTTIKTSIEVVDITKNQIAQIFDWEVITNKGAYSGTALSLEQANKMIALSSHREIIKDKKITSYLMLKSEVSNNANRNYFWEVKTVSGFAKGYASTEAYAHKMIQLVASNDAVIDKKIISQPQQ